jgi:hypothetical protein
VAADDETHDQTDMPKTGTLLRKCFGYLLIGAILFFATLWGAQIVSRLVWIVRHPGEVAQGPPGVLFAAITQLLVCVLAAVIFLSMGRRLVDPRHFDRRVEERARRIARENEGSDSGTVKENGVSCRYGDLSLEQLVLIHGALDRDKYEDRYRAVVAAIIKKT